MNYYPHHIGDFNNATRHLTRVERSIYRDLIELYYDSECPLTSDFKSLCRKVIAKSDEEVTAVEQVLNEFFTNSDQGWRHDRCDNEILKYQDHIKAKSIAGKASAAKRAVSSQFSPQTPNDSSTTVEHTLNERSTNQEPRTKNQEPKEKTKSKDLARGTRLPVDWFLPKEWGEWALVERPELTNEAIRGIAEQFKDYWISIPGQRGTKLDWCATWRNRIRDIKTPVKPNSEKFDPIAYVNRFAKKPEEYDEKIIEH